MPSKRAAMQQQVAAKGKTASGDTIPPAGERSSARLDPKTVSAGGNTCEAPSPQRVSPRLNASPNAKSQYMEIRKRKTGSSEAAFAAVDPPAGNEMTVDATVETTPSDFVSTDNAEETVLSKKDNEVLEESAVRKTRTRNPNYLDESDDDLHTYSSKRKEVQKSSSVEKTRGNKRVLDEEDFDAEDEGEEEQSGDEDPKDNGNSDEGFKSPLKQQPAIKKLTRGRQRKPFSPAGNRTAP